MHRTIHLLGLLLLAAPIVAQDREAYIINGQPTDSFPSVGIVGEASVGGFCTGTLISQMHVLTAAHCAQAILDAGTADSGTFELAGRVYRTASVEIIPTFNPNLFTDDVGILVLAEPVTEVQPAELSDGPPAVGEIVTIVGYGGQGIPEEGSDGSFGTKLVGNVTVDEVTDYEFSWLFDDPTESNPAPGDSGGPVFVEAETGFLLVGIVSSGTAAEAQLGDTSFNMRVDAYEPWITDTVLATMDVSDPVGDDPPEESPDQEEEEDDDESQTPETNGDDAGTCGGKPAWHHGRPHHHHHHHHGCGCHACVAPPPCTATDQGGAETTPASDPTEEGIGIDESDPPDSPTAPAGDLEPSEDMPPSGGTGPVVTPTDPSDPAVGSADESGTPAQDVLDPDDTNAGELETSPSGRRRHGKPRRTMRRPVGSYPKWTYFAVRKSSTQPVNRSRPVNVRRQ